MQTQKLRTPDGELGDEAGQAVAANATTLFVGASGDDDHGNRSGAVYVFERSSSDGWTAVDKLHASDAASRSEFGFSLALSGSTLLVGAFDAEKVYVFERSPATGRWSETAKLRPSDGEPLADFGWSVSILGDVAVVGARLANFQGSHSGAAYIFERDLLSGQWLESKRLLPSDGDFGFEFGSAVILNGATLMVGAIRARTDVGESGVVYAFEPIGLGGEWVETQRIVRETPEAGGNFGASIAIDGEMMVIGEPHLGISGDGGTAHVFERDETSGLWLEGQTITVSALLRTDFGVSMAIDGESLIIGGRFAPGVEIETGAVWIFFWEPVSGRWVEEEQIVPSDGRLFDGFGQSVAWAGSDIAVGSYQDDEPSLDSGSAYILERVRLAGSATGIRTGTVQCRNETTGDGVAIPLGGASAWDCAEAGLQVQVGDTLTMRVDGFADGFDLSGATSGWRATDAGCRNNTTGFTVVADLPDDFATVWNCALEGLMTSPGDRVTVFATGLVNQ